MGSELLRVPQAVLFDWDNTLVDTWPVIHEAMNTTLAAMGQPIWHINETRARVRLALREAFPPMFGDRWEEAREIFYFRFREIHLNRLEVMPGAEDVLQTLAQRGVYLGVVSNKMGDHLRKEAVHLGWDKYFGQIVGATDAVRDKPAREPVEMALLGSGAVAGPSVWFVGDTEIDMECGDNSGCIKILIRKETPSGGEFTKYYPDEYFKNCKELCTLVSRL
ncbi:HAD family hydrolase [Alphaproteobacteria bacterium]|nr:HAD family hydrolase [Alphaproteobacteria bacterium]